MAVTVSNDASTFRRTANLPSLAALTIFGWFKPSTVTPARWWGPFGLMNAIDGASGRTISSFSSGSAQLVLEYTNSGGTFVSNALLTTTASTWYFIALTSAGNAIGNVTAYIRALSTRQGWDNTVTNSQACNSFTPGALDFGREGFTGEFMSGDMHGFGVIDAVLSSDELLRLSCYHDAHLRGLRSVNCFFPGIESVNTNVTVDHSGNGRNATSTPGALTDGPPLLWKPSPLHYPLAASAPSGAIAGTTTLTLSPSGALAGAGAMSGSAALTLSPSGALAAAGALAGSTTLTLSPSGALAGAGAMSGSAALTLSPSGALTGAGSIAGSIALTFAPSGALGAGGAISGSATLTLSPSGALTGAGAMSGTATLTLSPSGAVAGAGALVGTATLTLAPSGAIAGAGAMSGSAALALTFTGNLAPADSLAGNIALTLAPSGVASGAGAMSGSATLALSPSGTLAGVGSLSGSTSLTFGGSGDLEGEQPSMAGSLALTLALSGALEAAAGLAGSFGITFTPAGRLVRPCEDLVFNVKDPDTDDLLAVAFLDKYERFAKAESDVAIVRLFYLSIYCDPIRDLTRAQYKALTSSKRRELWNAPSAAGLVDTEGKSNA